jgi:hypothetical protein
MVEPPGTTSLVREVRRPFFLMMVLLVGAYLAIPHVGSSVPAGTAVVVTLCLTLLLGVRASSCGQRSVTIAWILTVLILITTAALAITGVESYGGLRLLLAIFNLYAVVNILRSVMRATRIDGDKIYAAICVLFLMGLFWASLYEFLDRVLLDAFTGHDHMQGELKLSARSTELLYFSFVTLTTLGYGDIAPLHPLTRSLATIEALSAQLYIGVLIARLVALHILDTSRERSA